MLRKSLELSQTDFGKRLGKNYHSVMRWELGKVLPPSNVIDYICTTFSVNKDWLENGTGEIFTKANSTAAFEAHSRPYTAQQTENTLPNQLTEGFITDNVRLSCIDESSFILRAPNGSTPPVLPNDILVVHKCNVADADGLYLVSNLFDDVFVRYYKTSLGIFLSKLTDYPDLDLKDAKIHGKINKTFREIHL